jgi:hypothetical protein
MRRAALPLAMLLAACSADLGAGPDAAPAAPDAEAWTGTAPPGTVPGEIAGGADNQVDVDAGGAQVFRFETVAGEHLGFRFDFAPGPQDVVMVVDRWDGAQPVFIGETDAGAGLRVLAVVDQDGPRTFWVTIEARGADAVSGTLAATRTPFTEGAICADDCAHLLQLPLPNDVARDGYDVSNAVFRYQFGRRDLLMFLREAGRQMAAAGDAPFQPEDLSQWDGETPGSDVGAPRHASHMRGKDVDLSLYGTDNGAQWRSFCTVEYTADGRECIAGSRSALFDGGRNSRMVGVFAATGRMTMGFLDGELIPALDPEQPLLQHWPNHDNHVHVRVSEVEDGTAAPGPIEPP